MKSCFSSGKALSLRLPGNLNWEMAHGDAAGKVCREMLMAQQAIHSLSLGSMYALLAIGLTLLYAAERSLYLAYGALYAMGGYVVWWTMRSNHPIGLALALAMLLCAVLGVGLVGWWRWVCARRPLQVSLLHGLGILILMEEAWRLLIGPEHRKVIAIDSHQIHHVGPLMFSDMHWLVFGCAFACFIALQGFLTTRRSGVALGALVEGQGAEGEENEPLAGEQAAWLRLLACAVGAALAGVSGVLAGLYINDVHPAMGVNMTHKIISFALIGTLGSLRGVVLTAYGLALVEGIVLPALRLPLPAEGVLLLALLLASLRGAAGRTNGRQPLQLG
jgi:branched-subunit amino acid ABC-type transport system permease component